MARLKPDPGDYSRIEHSFNRPDARWTLVFDAEKSGNGDIECEIIAYNHHDGSIRAAITLDCCDGHAVLDRSYAKELVDRWKDEAMKQAIDSRRRA